MCVTVGPPGTVRRPGGIVAARRRPLLTAVVLATLVCCSSGCSRTVRLPVEDMRLAFAVRTALVNDAEVGAAPIEVLARDGVVTLDGHVATSVERERIVNLARGISGVRRVETRITVGAPSASEPSDTADSARQISTLPPPDPWPPSRHLRSRWRRRLVPHAIRHARRHVVDLAGVPLRSGFGPAPHRLDGLAPFRPAADV